MRELRAAGAFADCPDTGCCRLQSLVDTDKATGIELDARLFKPDIGGIRYAPRCYEQIAAGDRPLPGSRVNGNADFIS